MYRMGALIGSSSTPPAARGEHPVKHIYAFVLVLFGSAASARAQTPAPLTQGIREHLTAVAQLVERAEQQMGEQEVRLVAMQDSVKKLRDQLASSRPVLSAVGVNIESPMDWMRTHIFIDVMKTARPFGNETGPWGPKEYLPLEPDGYPAAGPFASLVMSEQVGVGGVYKFICKGKVDRIGGVATKVGVANLAYDESTNRTTADVTLPDNGGTIRWQPAEGHRLTNLKLLRPGYSEEQNEKQIFTDAFQKSIEPFGTIRAMDLNAANESRVKTWDGRAKITDPTYHKSFGKGVPYETLIELGARTGKNIWLCLPGEADEAFIEQFCAMLKEKVRYDRVVYIEYANEVWNTMFPQTKYNAEQAKIDAELADTPKWAQPHARVAKMIAMVAKQLDYPNDPRFRPILATQLSNFDGVTKPQLDFLKQSRGGVAKNIWAVAVAPYYNDGGAEFNKAKRGTTLEDYFKPVEQDQRGWLWWRVSRTAEWVKKHAAAAKENGVHAICYEGGMDLGQFETQYPDPDAPENKNADGSVKPWKQVKKWVNPTLDAKIALQIDPRMEDITRYYLTAQRDAGMAEVVYFTLCGRHTRFGFFGLTDRIDDLDQPKFRGARDVAGKWQLP